MELHHVASEPAVEGVGGCCRDGVVGPAVAALDLDQAGVEELLDVVGEQRLVDLKQCDQLALTDRSLAAVQHIHDLDTQRLGQRLRCGRDPLGRLPSRVVAV